ncbi:MAG: FCD domain-containing protein [Candidatus Omnitrophota bacterium]
MNEIYFVRSAVEGIAAREAVRNVNQQVLHQLELYIKKYEGACQKGDRAAGERADRLFHEKVAELSGNRYLNWLMKKIRMLTTSFMIAERYCHSKKDLNPYSHARIVKALATGDPDIAEEVLQKHILWSKDSFLKLRSKKEKRRIKTKKKEREKK